VDAVAREIVEDVPWWLGPIAIATHAAQESPPVRRADEAEERCARCGGPVETEAANNMYCVACLAVGA
jgi:hypothetical protein